MKKFFERTGSEMIGAILLTVVGGFLYFNHNASASPDVRYIGDVEPLNITPSSETVQKEFMHFTSGTGFFVTDHHIVTNEHVVRDCKHIRIRGAVSPGYAKLRSIDKTKDLALLVTNRTPTRIAPLRGDIPLLENEKVTVMGYPLEHGINGDYLITEAIVTNTHDNYNGVDRIQFTDAVAKGNSGGPLLDSNGAVVGVVVGKMSFYLTDANGKEEAEPVKTSSVAVSLDTLKGFLDENQIYYRADNTQYEYAEGWMESKAKQYVVNIHCVKD